LSLTKDLDNEAAFANASLGLTQSADYSGIFVTVINDPDSTNDNNNLEAIVLAHEIGHQFSLTPAHIENTLMSPNANSFGDEEFHLTHLDQLRDQVASPGQ